MKSNPDIQDLRLKILRGNFDQATKVQLFKIIENGPTNSELNLVCTLISWSERYNNQQSEMKKQA